MRHGDNWGLKKADNHGDTAGTARSKDKALTTEDTESTEKGKDRFRSVVLLLAVPAVSPW
jgi:hypothetical protein